jgi:hypothetical protein
VTTQRRVLVVGAGLGGMVAAVAAREAGADVTVFERHDAPGGATVHSVGWVWRYRDLHTARACAPHGDPQVQRAVLERLDGDLEWLEARGMRPRATGTGRALTEGLRIDPPQVLDALAERLDEDTISVRSSVLDARPAASGGIELLVRRGRPGAVLDEPDEWIAGDAVVFAGGGYAADFDRVAGEAGAAPEVRDEWVLRAPLAGNGTSMDAAIGLGALRVHATGESLARVAPRIDAAASARELGRYGELHVADTVLRDAHGSELPRADHDWSGAQQVWQLARTTGAGRLEIPRSVLRRELRSGTVEDVVRAAVAAGADSGRVEGGGVWLAVRAGITHTMCGVRVDGDGRLLQVPAARGLLRRGGNPRPIPSAFAVGCDAAGTGLGGTASGLAQALVLGRRSGALAGAGD